MSNISRRIEEASLNAWPAMQQIIYDGWILRFSRGYTKRANSVNPLFSSTIDLGSKIALCERLYAEMDLPTIFRLTSISPALELDKRLARRGYRKIDLTRVMHLDVREKDFQVDQPVEFREESREEWMGIFSDFQQSPSDQQKLHEAVLKSIPCKVKFASIRRDGQPMACGLGVLENLLVGLFDLVTAPSERRKGYGTSLLRGLLTWAHKHGAASAYLQVMKENAPARRLYHKEGFRDLYHYWYRIRA